MEKIYPDVKYSQETYPYVKKCILAVQKKYGRKYVEHAYSMFDEYEQGKFQSEEEVTTYLQECIDTRHIPTLIIY